MLRIDQQSYALACPGDGGIHLLRVPVAAAALDVAMQKVMGHGVQNTLRRLSAGGIIEEDEAVLKRGKSGAYMVHREIRHGQIIYLRIARILSPCRVELELDQQRQIQPV